MVEPPNSLEKHPNPTGSRGTPPMNPWNPLPARSPGAALQLAAPTVAEWRTVGPRGGTPVPGKRPRGPASTWPWEFTAWDARREKDKLGTMGHDQAWGVTII